MQTLNVIAWNRNAKTVCLFGIPNFPQHFEVSTPSQNTFAARAVVTGFSCHGCYGIMLSP